MEEKQSITAICDKFHKDLIQLINDSGLPLALVYYIYKDVFNEIQAQYIKETQS